MVKGITLALIEVSLIFYLGYNLKKLNKFQNINGITFYWLLFTTITGIWEFSFLINYNLTCQMAYSLLQNHEHVWTSDYLLIDILPIKFSKLFYAEYGAYADREYMKPNNNWSRIIEGTHLIFCGLGSFLALLLKKTEKEIIKTEKEIIKTEKEKQTINKYYLIFVSSAMSSQAMNSILYMVNYLYEIKDSLNPNYNSTDFPIGNYLNKRPFMYINILWTIMPLYVLLNLIYSFNKIRY